MHKDNEQDCKSYSDKHGLKDLIKDLQHRYTNNYKPLISGEIDRKQLKYCAQDVVYLHKIYESLLKILIREKRIDLYSKTIKFISTRVDLDFASFKEDIWSH